MKEKISRTLTGIKLSEDHIKKLSDSKRGKELTQETKIKIKESWKKRKMNKTYKEKHSKDTISKMKSAVKSRWEKQKNLKIGILGGSFSPITKGHIYLAEYLLDNSILDKIVFMPCFRHKHSKKLINFDHRYNMIKTAVKLSGKVSISAIEKTRDLNGSTYDLFQTLQKIPFYQKTNLYFIIGQDNANSFHKWVNYEHLERLIRFVVVHRKGIKPAEGVDWYLKPPHIYLHGETTIPEISSTEIRGGLKTLWQNGTVTETVGEMLHPDVLQYIKDNGLYKPEE